MSQRQRSVDARRSRDAVKPPRQVLLFSGHMMDAPGRATPRFPAEKEAAAARAIEQALEGMDAGPEDIALAQAAAGGDLLFLEGCLRRGVRCTVLLPFPEDEFIERSILPSTHGPAWRDRYLALRDRLDAVRIMPDELGPLPEGADPYERANLWLLQSAMACGPDKVRFLCLWNGSGGDGPGGTAHLYAEVERRHGRVNWIDVRKL